MNNIVNLIFEQREHDDSGNFDKTKTRGKIQKIIFQESIDDQNFLRRCCNLFGWDGGTIHQVIDRLMEYIEQYELRFKIAVEIGNAGDKTIQKLQKKLKSYRNKLTKLQH